MTTWMVTGHRKCAAEDHVRSELERVIPLLVDRFDMSVFCSGIARGADQTAVEAGGWLDGTASSELHVYLPYPTQPLRWTKRDLIAWELSVAAATVIHVDSDWPVHASKDGPWTDLVDQDEVRLRNPTVDTEPSLSDLTTAVWRRNRAMVEASVGCVAVWDGNEGSGTGGVLRIARELERHIITIDASGRAATKVTKSPNMVT